MPALDFETHFTVRVSDLNYGAHLGNDRVLTLFHEARVRWLASMGWSELDIDGVGIIQTEAHIRYRGQARLADELACALKVEEVRSRGFTLRYDLRRPSDNTRIATGTTTLCFFDYSAQRLEKTPESFLSRLKSP